MFPVSILSKFLYCMHRQLYSMLHCGRIPFNLGLSMLTNMNEASINLNLLCSASGWWARVCFGGSRRGTFQRYPLVYCVYQWGTREVCSSFHVYSSLFLCLPTVIKQDNHYSTMLCKIPCFWVCDATPMRNLID
jgi:hypothetical protein